MNIQLNECGKAHGEQWMRWLAHIVGQPAWGLELGTWMGESAEWMLENVFTNEKSAYYCVDTFEGSAEHHLGGVDCKNLEKLTRDRLARFSHRAQIFKGKSHEALGNMFMRDRFDFIYVDASHDAMNVLRDSVLAFGVLKVGGIMVWDDYLWQVYPEEVDCPRMAIDAFWGCYARQVEVLAPKGGWQVAAKKIA